MKQIPRYKVGPLQISSVAPASFLEHVVQWKQENGGPQYICVTNVRMVYEGRRSPRYRDIQNNSFLSVPDGMPLVWLAHITGHQDVKRCCGYDVTRILLENSTEAEDVHYFYGSSPQVIEILRSKLAEQYPGLKIANFESPPFRALTEEEYQALVQRINECKPRYFWIGIGAPKQDILAARLANDIHSNTLLIGVGLVFDYFAGTVKRAPRIFRSLGLEWLYRVSQQPIRSRRFLVPLIYFLLLLVGTWFRTLGKRFKRRPRNTRE